MVKKEKRINAKDKKCDFEKCKEKGYRFVLVDMDLPALCFCERHLMEWEMRLFLELNKNR